MLIFSRKILPVLAFVICVCISPLASAFDLQAHRGGRGLMPENTLAAFAHALSLGVNTLELDTGVTKDGVVVVSHNQQLDAAITRDQQMNWLVGNAPLIHELTYEELAKFDVGRINPASKLAKRFGQQKAQDGEKIPTLKAVFDLVKKSGNKDVRFNIETKINPEKPGDSVEPKVFVKALLDEINAAGFGKRVAIQSFDWRTLLAVQKMSPDTELVFLTAPKSWLSRMGPEKAALWIGANLADFQNSFPRLIKSLGGKIWSPFSRDADQESIDEAHALGIQVVVWTVNDKSQMKQLIQMGVDGIISDYPDRLREVLAEEGMNLPIATPVAQ
ncbi:MAG: glycerophosphodiester phosphodiesterase [Rhizobiaceae bacterium]